jgi:hypothetical protein
LQIVKQVTNIVDAFSFHVDVQCLKPGLSSVRQAPVRAIAKALSGFNAS